MTSEKKIDITKKIMDSLKRTKKNLSNLI